MKENKKPTKTDLKALDALKDRDIDYSDIPELDEEFFANAEIIEPQKKQSVTIRYDKEIIDYFKESVGQGYQTKINAVLKAYVQAHLKSQNRRRT